MYKGTYTFELQNHATSSRLSILYSLAVSFDGPIEEVGSQNRDGLTVLLLHILR